MARRVAGPTIYDVALGAGVSANTVSRALNGKSGVSKETRARIRAVAHEMGYYPHLGARSLRVKREGLIGLTLPSPLDRVPLSEAFFLSVFSTLYRLFGARGERLCFDMHPYVDPREEDYGRSLWQGLYSACIVAGPLASDDQTIHKIHASGVPYVAFGRLDRLPEVSSAAVDYEAGAYLGTRRLLERGHTRVALLKALEGYQPGVERERGYRRALAEAGINPDPALVHAVGFGARDVAHGVHSLLKEPGVTALLDTSGAEDGEGLREGARRAGRTPGDDFEVVCWTYHSRGVVLEEAAAHLWLPAREAASEGLEALADWYFGRREGPVRVIYPPTMMDTAELLADGADTIDRPQRLFNPML